MCAERNFTRLARSGFASIALVTTLVALLVSAAAPGRVGAQTYGDRLDNLETDVENMEDDRERLLTPIAILISVLAVGGVLSVVFSFRDQRRAAQLHELAVTSETSSQRRTDETYTLFLDASQRTLTLVNDTLELAREATQEAHRSMALKAQNSLNRTEQRARGFVLRHIERDFEAVVEKRESRDELQGIAAELKKLEGYLFLQDIELPPYSRFVKGIDHHLRDETQQSLDALLEVSQDETLPNLQLLSRYWIGYLYNTRGEYRAAAESFRAAMADAPEKDPKRLELERKVEEADFFRIASDTKVREPRDRLGKVTQELERLEQLAKTLDEHEHDKSGAASHRVAETRASVFTWIAFDPHNPVGRLKPNDIKHGKSILPDEGAKEIGGVKRLKDFENAPGWEELDGDALRAWALDQARRLYKWQEAVDKDFDLFLGQAECDFLLDEQREIGIYEEVQRKAENRLAWHREPRETAELDQTVVICQGRILQLRQEEKTPNSVEIENAKADLRSAHADAKRALGDVGEGITVMSHLQKRNLRKEQFASELHNFEEQLLDPDAFAKRIREAAGAEAT
jgi:hypothetical protein